MSLLSAVPPLGSNRKMQCGGKAMLLLLFECWAVVQKRFLGRIHHNFALHVKLMSSLDSDYNQYFY